MKEYTAEDILKMIEGYEDSISKSKEVFGFIKDVNENGQINESELEILFNDEEYNVFMRYCYRIWGYK